MAVFCSGATLPDRPTYVEYIETDGNQYIDTGFKPNNNTRVVMDVAMAADSGNNVLFGARVAAADRNYTFFWQGGSSRFRSDYNTEYTQVWSVTQTTRRTVDKNKETTTVDGTGKSYTNAAFQTPWNLLLLALNDNGTVKWNALTKLYSCKVYDNGTLIRDYRPCIDGKGVVCLRDEVNNEYVYNAGSGEFTAGGVI